MYLRNMASDLGTLRVPNPGLRVQLCRWRRMDYWVHEGLATPVWRVYWNPTPGAWVDWSGRRFELTPDRWLLITPSTPFATGHDGPFEHFFIHFVLGPDFRPVEPAVTEGPAVGDMLEVLRHLAGQAKAGRLDPARDGLLVQRAVTIALTSLPPEAWHRPVADRRIRRALEMIHEHLHRPQTNAELARRLNLHPKSFARLFAAEMGTSPYRYGLRMRLGLAAEQLLHTTDSVEKVAEDWGFTDRFHLTRMMATHLETTPGRLRRRVS